MKFKLQNILGTLAMLLALLPVSTHAATSPNDREAFSILKKRCFECHGKRQQRNGLRLDSLESAQHGGDSLSPAVTSGSSATSLMIQKITSTDPAVRMPFGKPALSTHEITVLKTWIDEGTAFPAAITSDDGRHSHWAFNPPQQAVPPEITNPKQARSPIDNFIFAKARDNGLTPSPEADKYTLVRRLYLELIGLPPTPEEVLAFVNDKSENAYDNLLDKLFVSPHYGERQARRWLDVARYADTNGYEKDRPRSIWPYRDWVINAFNTNMPFDQFVLEQMAGDLLPSPTESQLIATGFHRNAMLNEEGGIDAAEDRFKRTVDRTNTTSTAFLGLTMSCAQCHSHKFDPISRTEYYRFFAFLNDPNETTLRLSNPDIEAKRAHADNMQSGLNKWLAFMGQRNSKMKSGYETWRKEAEAKASNWTIPTPASMLSKKGATLTLQPDGSILAEGDIPNDDVYTLEFATPDTPITAIRLEVLPDESLPGGGPGRGVILAEGDFLLTEFELAIAPSDKKGEAVAVPISTATQDYAAENKTAAQALDGKSDTGWSVKDALANPHHAVFQLERPLEPTPDSKLRITLRQDYIHQHTIGRFRLSFTSKSGEVVASGIPANIESVLAKTKSSRTKQENADVEAYYYQEVAKLYRKWRKQRDKMAETKPNFATTLVMAPRIPDRDTHVYNRGEFLSPRKTVDPGVPNIFPSLPEGAPLNRVTLAKWITDKQNPLTARVTMNRLWQQVFGHGIVTTPEDFGVEGEPPTHPQLLDWLAVEFMNHNWNLQAMHRLMVSSAAFRQQSTLTPDHQTIDPTNVWLARGPRLRLQAEAVRDAALTASGLLTRTLGGPSVYPPQPDGVNALAYGSTSWPTAKGPNRYRRGLYTYMKRTAPYAGFMVFDAPTAEATCVRRARTNTPLQALTLLNDPVYMEATQALAVRTAEQKGNLKKKIDYLYLACLSRLPDKTEQSHIAEFYTQMKSHFDTNPNEAIDLMPETEANPDLAAWIAVSRVVLNLDEMITRS